MSPQFNNHSFTEAQKHAGAGPTQRLWTPLFLSKSSLVAFSVTFVALAVGLAVLYAWSEMHQGLVSTDESLHYLWTYGPTAILTIVAALWGRLSFRTRELTPWQVLLQGPASAKDTLFLDYISPWVGSILWSSLRARHVAVALAVAGTLLMKLAIVVSTGLLTLQTRVLHVNSPFVALNQFSGEGYNRSVSMEDPRIYSTLFGALQYRGGYPLGTTHQYAYQTFNASDAAALSPTTTLRGEVDAFHAGLSPSVPQYSLSDKSGSMNSPEFLPYNFFGYNYDLTNVDSTDWEGLLLSGIYLQPSLEIHITVVYCDLEYAISRANLTLDNPFDPVPTLDASSSAEHRTTELPGISKFDILDTVRKALIGLPPEAIQDFYDPWFDAMAVASPQPEISSWLNASAMVDAAERAFGPIAAQMARKYWLTPSNESFTGMRTSREARLVVQPLSSGLMEGILAVMAMASLALFFFAPRAVCPRDPASIGGLATILATSGSLNRVFEGTGSWNIQTLSHAVGANMYQAGVSSARPGSAQFSIWDVDGEKDTPRLEHNIDSDSKLTWWRPFSSTIPAQTLAFLGPVGLIIAVELLFQHSQKYQGIVGIGPGRYLPYLWTYLPALTMLGVSMLYDTLDFGARVFQPYSLLHRRPQGAHRGLSNLQLGRIALHGLGDSLRQGQVATAATSLAVIAGGLLTIAVSGLFTLRPVPLLTSLELVELDTFNFTRGDEFSFGKGIPVLILHSNLSYPQWTHADLAFPTLGLADRGIVQGLHNSTSTVSVTVPAVRARTNCTAVPPDNLNIYYRGERVELDYTIDHLDQFSPEHVPPTIPGGYPLPTEAYGPPNITGGFIFPGSYYGEVFDTSLRFLKLQRYGVQYVVVSAYAAPDHSNLSASMLFCSPYYESVQANLTLHVPSMQMDQSIPPVVNEQTVHYVGSLPYEPYSFLYYSADGSYLQGLSHMIISDPRYNTTYDGVFSSMAYGVDGVPPPQLVGNENIGRLQEAFQRVYGIVQAQQVGFQFRNATPPDRRRRRLPAVLRSANRVRLVQGEISTRLLQGLLGLMLLCAAVTFFAVDTRNTLPNNPCSIGGRVSLLAGSEMLGPDVIPPGAEWCSDRELQRKGVFEGRMFSLGWWKGLRFGIGIGQADDPDPR